eukprot:scaffold148898_cov30-Tisochrysis_lutea.AAC.1
MLLLTAPAIAVRRERSELQPRPTSFPPRTMTAPCLISSDEFSATEAACNRWRSVRPPANKASVMNDGGDGIEEGGGRAAESEGRVTPPSSVGFNPSVSNTR